MPRRVLLIVAVVLAAVIGTVSVYSYNKREEAQKAAQKKARDKTASQAVVAPVAPSGPLDHAVHDAEEARGRPAASQPAVSLVRKPTLTAEQFQGQAGMQDDGEKARRAAEQQKEFDLYSAPIFKGGNKLDAQHHGQQDGTAGQMDPMLASIAGLQKAAADKGAADGTAAQVAASLAHQNAAPQDRDKQFLDGEEGANHALDKVTLAGQLPKCTIGVGAFIESQLVTGINSDKPGLFIAEIPHDVYDTIDGTCLVIPKGSFLTGRYDSDIHIGQTRLLAAVETLRFPNGQVVSLSGMPTADNGGYAGLDGDVNNHFLKIFGSSLAVGVLERAFNNQSTATTSGAGGITTYGDTAGQVLGQTAQVMLDRNRQIPPTITRDRGTSFIVEVTHNIELAPYVN